MLHKIKYEQFPYDVNSWGIHITEGKYRDIKFLMGKVEFKENEAQDNCTLKYNYDIIENPVEFTNQQEIDDFETFVGDLLMQMLDEGIKRNDLVYTGGVDEN